MRSGNTFVTFLVVLFLIILVQNTQVVTFRFLMWEFSMSQIILVLLTTLIGIVLGYTAAKSRWM